MVRRALLSSFLFTVVLIVAILLSGYYTTCSGEKPGFPRTAVERTLGAKGVELPDGVYMFSLPRDDLRVRVGDVTLSPAMALDSWVAFTDIGGESMVMGDLVLQPGELLAVQDSLRRSGLGITAIHNTLAGETPQVYDLHVGGSGDPEKMALALQAALKAANFTVSPSGNHTGTMPPYMPDTGVIDRIIGTSGTYEDGVLQYRMPRAEKITENGMEIPPSLDIATLIKFQPLPGRSAALVGEFVLVAAEVQPVFDALNDHGITVTAAHSHMLDEQPRLFYLHIWAVGDPVKLASGVRAALDQVNLKNYTKGATQRHVVARA